MNGGKLLSSNKKENRNEILKETTAKESEHKAVVRADISLQSVLSQVSLVFYSIVTIK